MILLLYYALEPVAQDERLGKTMRELYLWMDCWRLLALSQSFNMLSELTSYCNEAALGHRPRSTSALD